MHLRDKLVPCAHNCWQSALDDDCQGCLHPTSSFSWSRLDIIMRAVVSADRERPKDRSQALHTLNTYTSAVKLSKSTHRRAINQPQEILSGYVVSAHARRCHVLSSPLMMLDTWAIFSNHRQRWREPLRGHDSAWHVFAASRHNVSWQNFLRLGYRTSMSGVAEFYSTHIGIQCA